jgi:subtilisin family serine protease
MSGDNIRGVSTEKAYQTILKGRTSKPVIVAVIDSGVDIEHEDLKDNLWVNAKEIANNGIDDDKNGYVDDVYGWNFIGGKDGKNVSKDTYEMTRMYVFYKKKFDGKGESDIPKADAVAYKEYLNIKDKFETKIMEIRQNLMRYKMFAERYAKSKRLLEAYLETDEITIDQLRTLDSSDEKIKEAVQTYGSMLLNGVDDKRLKEIADYFDNQIKYGYNTEFDPRSTVGDNYSNVNEKYYGNNDVVGKGGDSKHGTHVAGIIAANRKNDIGMKGVADNVKIMTLRAVPDGDERDKDIANSIRYAVDNGARIINMSFGKSYSPDKKAVDEAMQYAASKGVLLVHAAGNDSKNLDSTANFPNRKTLKKKDVPTWLEIGAASWGDNDNFVGDFSNYGKTTVDLFSPGVDIYSTTPDQKYESLDGTSMAAPVAAGVAAVIMAYFPELSAAQVKEAIMKSVVKFPNTKIVKPGEAEGDDEKTKMIDFSQLSMSGGLINVYEAVKLAEVMSKKISKK